MKAREILCGIDEAGRGALAGPVVAGACIIATKLFRRRIPCSGWSPFSKKCNWIIADSKQLTPKLRDEAYLWIIHHCAYGCGVASHREVEELGILGATERAMQRAVKQLCEKIKPTCLLVDGRDHFWFDLPHIEIIRGDQSEACIAAASIIAKVTRDRLMCEEHRRFPLYGFAQHKGYGTPAHIKNIKAHGSSVIHRRSFLRNFTNDTGSFDDGGFSQIQRSAPIMKMGRVSS